MCYYNGAFRLVLQVPLPTIIVIEVYRSAINSRPRNAQLNHWDHATVDTKPPAGRRHRCGPSRARGVTPHIQFQPRDDHSQPWMQGRCMRFVMVRLVKCWDPSASLGQDHCPKVLNLTIYLMYSLKLITAYIHIVIYIYSHI